MSFVIGHHPGHFSHSPNHDHPHGDGWKFGLAALAMTAAGATFVYSPLLRNEGEEAGPPTIPAVEFLEPVFTRLVDPSEVVRQPVTTESTAPAQVIPAELTAARQQAAVATASVAPMQQTAGIRNIDFTALPTLQVLARQLGGRVDQAQVKYADLTRDGGEEAVVPITSDGTSGNLALVVFTMRAGGPAPILTRLAGRERRGLIATFDGNQVAETSGVYGPSDPNCCPSQLVKTYFRWDGQDLVVDRTQTITIPQGKLAD